MSAKTKKLIIQKGKNKYGEEAAEETKDDEFDGGDEESEEACAEEIALDRECA